MPLFNPPATPFTLSAFGSTPNANGLTLASNVLNMQPADATHPGGVSTVAQAFGGDKTFTRILLPTGTVNPVMTFTGDTTTGLIAGGSGFFSFYSLGNPAIDIRPVGTGQINVGLGSQASPSIGNACTANYTRNGIADYNYSNLSTGANAVTRLSLGAGPSGANPITIENHGYDTNAYIGGCALLSASTSLFFLNICSEIVGGGIRFNVEGRTSATERMSLTKSALTLKNGANMVFSSYTTTAKNALTVVAGTQVYDTTLNQMSYYNGTTWINF